MAAVLAGGFFAWQWFGGTEEVVQDETADWETYRNEQYGIEFRYPNDWILDDKEALSISLPDQTKNIIQINVSNGVSGREDESMSPCQPDISSVVYQVGKLRNSQQTFEGFVNFQIENPERGLPPKVKPKLISTTVGGHNALKIEGTVNNCDTEFYYIEQRSDHYTTISFIVEKNDDELVINQILSTFRFLEIKKTSDIPAALPKAGEKPYIEVIFPNGGEKLVKGNTYDITWESKGIEHPITLAIIGSSDYLEIASYIPASSGKYSWTVPYFKNEGGVYKIEILDLSSMDVRGFSDNYFSIISDPTSPSIIILSPNGGEKLEIGKTYDITWQANGIQEVDITLLHGLVPYPIARRVPATLGKYSWRVSDIVNEQYWIGNNIIDLIGFTSIADGDKVFRDESDRVFSITR